MNKLCILAFCLSVLNINAFSQEYLEKGKKDTLVIEIDSHNKIYIPEIYPSDYAEENPTEEMYINAKKFREGESLDITFNPMWALGGNILDNIMYFDVEKDFTINYGRCKLSESLLFYEDDSDGITEESDSYYSDWIYAEVIDGDKLQIPTNKEFPNAEIPEEEYAAAEKKKLENPNLYYHLNTDGVIMELNYTLKGKTYTKEINFLYGYGD